MGPKTLESDKEQREIRNWPVSLTFNSEFSAEHGKGILFEHSGLSQGNFYALTFKTHQIWFYVPLLRIHSPRGKV